MSDVRGSSAPTLLRPRRNLRWIAAGVLAICLGGLGSAVLFTSLADARSVLRVNRTVYRGEVVQATDLGVISIGRSLGLRTVAAEEAPALVGRTALVDLADGALVVPGSLGDPVLQAGTVLIGLKLAPGRITVSSLPAGTAVLLVPTAKDGEQPDGPSVAATVATSPVQAADGSSLLDVTVAAAEQERVARLAAAEKLSLIRRAGG